MTLQVDRVRLARFLARFGRPVLRELWCSAKAARARRVVHRRTGRRYLVLPARAGWRRFWIFARPVGDREAVRVLAIRELEAQPENEGYWHREWQQQLVHQLGYRHGLTPVWSGDPQGAPGVIRDSMPQLGPGGAYGANKPDHAYVAADGRRVNVEIDTNPLNSAYHMRNLTRRDPGAVHVGIMLDGNGAARRTYVYDPVSRRTMRYDGLPSLPTPQNAAGYATRLDALPPGLGRVPLGPGGRPQPISYDFTGLPQKPGVVVSARSLDAAARRAPLAQALSRRQDARRQLDVARARGGGAARARGGGRGRSARESEVVEVPAEDYRKTPSGGPGGPFNCA
jgi:hypothetical protein